ncbi:phosphatase PAP2 family protein [Candidatus Palauibacter sp.]|uniref:phosphatase PAP2 family protein n=1 Tax=Candidatus Palauibacter sp. TaxID=3101350 RepID=UPI003AF1F359
MFLSPLHVFAQAPEPTAAPEAANPKTGRIWRDIGLGAGGMGVAFLLDGPTRDLVLDHQGSAGRDLAEIGHGYGDWKKTAPFLAGGGILLGVALEGDRGARKATAAFFGVFAGSMANTFLNWTLGRSRPRDEMGSLHFDPLRSNASLGSGHTAYAFAIAAAVDEVTDGAWAIPFYAVAAGTGIARVYGDRHWLSDILAGGFVGLWVGRRATRAATGWLHVEGSPGAPGDPAVSAVRIEPLVLVDGLGVRLRF